MTNSKFRSLILLMLAFLAFVGCRKTTKEDIHDNIPPSVTFLAPQNNAFIDGDSTVPFKLDVKDEDGSISKVELFADGRLLHTFNTEPWEIELPTSMIGSGQHSVVAIAQDDETGLGNATIAISVADERDSIVGTYTGIRIQTIVQNSTYYNDTTQITATITKSGTDSVIDIHFQPVLNYTPYAFFVDNGVFSPRCCAPHPPSMSLSNGRMLIYHRPGQGPLWYDYTLDKVQ